MSFVAWVGAATALITTVVLLAWIPRRAALADGPLPAAAAPAYMTYLQRLRAGATIVWLAALLVLRADEAPASPFGGTWGGALGGAALLGGAPVLVLHTVVGAMNAAAFRRLDTFPRTTVEAAAAAFWSAGRLVIPIMLAVWAIGNVIDRGTWLWLVVPGVASAVMVYVGAAVDRHGPEAVTRGPLRDRALELGAAAGLRLSEVYRVHTAWRHAGALASRENGFVAVTGHLVRAFPAREVDAIVAHEIAHAARQHVQKVQEAALAPVGVAAGSAAYCAIMGQYDVWRFTLPLGLLAAAWVRMLVAKHLDRRADRIAVDLTGDAEALISAIARCASLNRIPTRWHPWLETAASAKSLADRCSAIGRRAGLPQGRVDQIVAAPLDAPRYPDASQPDRERLYGAASASRACIAALGWDVLTSASVAGMAAWATGALNGVPTGQVAVLLVGSIALAFSIDARRLRAERALKARIRDAVIERLSESAPVPPDAAYVAIAPDPDPGAYSGRLDWDVGLLWFDGPVLRFRGEEGEVGLRATQVTLTGTWLRRVGWRRVPYVRVRWRPEPTAAPETLLIASAGEGAPVAEAAATRMLVEHISEWLTRAGSHPERDASAPTATPPVAGSVSMTLASPGPELVRALAAALLHTGAAYAAASVVGALDAGASTLGTWAAGTAGTGAALAYLPEVTPKARRSSSP